MNEIDLGPEVYAEEGQEVRSRLWDSFKKNDTRDTAGFRKWFFEEIDDLVQSLSKSARGPFTLTRQIVHQEFAEMVWESVKATSFLVQTQMRGFRADLPEDLSQSDLTAFNALYDAHGWSGDLIPLMFYAHFDLLRPLLEELYNADCPDDCRTAFANAVYLKTAMVKNRREADRLRKQRTKRIPEEQHPELETQDREWLGSDHVDDEQDELTNCAKQKFLRVIDNQGVEYAARIFLAKLEKMEPVSKKYEALATIRGLSNDNATNFLVTCATDCSTTPPIRIAAMNELMQCNYSESIGMMLEQAALRVENQPKERIAAINTLMALRERNSQFVDIAADIASRIMLLSTEVGGPPRVRTAILKAVRTMAAQQLLANAPQRQRRNSNGRQS
jgi:hypothetical protein